MLRNAGWMDLRPEGFARRFAKGDERIMFLESGFLVHVGVEDDESWMDPILDTYLEGEHWFFPLASSDFRDVFEALAEHMPKLLKPYSAPVTRGYVSSADLVRFERRSERWVDAIFELQGFIWRKIPFGCSGWALCALGCRSASIGGSCGNGGQDVLL